MKEAKKFTRGNPVTKLEIHQCFFNPITQAYMQRTVVDAKAIIGDNSPKYLLKKGYMVATGDAKTDYYDLTQEGQYWLAKGLARHIALHPEKASEVVTADPIDRTKPRPRRRIGPARG